MDHSAIVMWALVSAPVAGLLWICGHRLAAVRRAHHEEYLLRRAKEYGKSYALAVWLERGDFVVDEMPDETFGESLVRRRFQHSWEADAYIAEFVETLRPRVVALAREDAKAHSYRVALSNGAECERNERAFSNSELANAYEEEYQVELRMRRGWAPTSPANTSQEREAELSGFASGGFVQEEIARVALIRPVGRVAEEDELTVRFRALEEQAPGDDVAVEALVCPAHLTIQGNVPWVSCGHHTLPGGQVPPHLPGELRRIYWQNVTEEKKPTEARPSTRPQRRLRRRPGDA